MTSIRLLVGLDRPWRVYFHVLACGDQPILNLLTPKPPLVGAFETVAVGCLREATLHQVREWRPIPAEVKGACAPAFVQGKIPYRCAAANTASGPLPAEIRQEIATASLQQ